MNKVQYCHLFFCIIILSLNYQVGQCRRSSSDSDYSSDSKSSSVEKSKFDFRGGKAGAFPMEDQLKSLIAAAFRFYVKPGVSVVFKFTSVASLQQLLDILNSIQYISNSVRH